MRPDYRSDESIPEKQRLIEEAYGDQVPGYMLFHLGGSTSLSDAEEQMLNDTFFEGRTPGFGDKELHRSNAFSGSYLNHPPEDFQPFVTLRIRDARAMAYSIEIGGRTCHLIQVSNGDGTKPIINFLERWGPSPQDLRVGEGEDPKSVPTPTDPWGRQTAFVENTVTFRVTPSDEALPPEPRRLKIVEVTDQQTPPKKGPVARFFDWLLG